MRENELSDLKVRKAFLLAIADDYNARYSLFKTSRGRPEVIALLAEIRKLDITTDTNAADKMFRYFESLQALSKADPTSKLAKSLAKISGLSTNQLISHVFSDQLTDMKVQTPLFYQQLAFLKTIDRTHACHAEIDSLLTKMQDSAADKLHYYYLPEVKQLHDKVVRHNFTNNLNELKSSQEKNPQIIAALNRIDAANGSDLYTRFHIVVNKCMDILNGIKQQREQAEMAISHEAASRQNFVVLVEQLGAVAQNSPLKQACENLRAEIATYSGEDKYAAFNTRVSELSNAVQQASQRETFKEDIRYLNSFRKAFVDTQRKQTNPHALQTLAPLMNKIVHFANTKPQPDRHQDRAQAASLCKAIVALHAKAPVTHADSVSALEPIAANKAKRSWGSDLAASLTESLLDTKKAKNSV